MLIYRGQVTRTTFLGLIKHPLRIFQIVCIRLGWISVYGEKRNRGSAGGTPALPGRARASVSPRAVSRHSNPVRWEYQAVDGLDARFGECSRVRRVSGEGEQLVRRVFERFDAMQLAIRFGRFVGE